MEEEKKKIKLNEEYLSEEEFEKKKEEVEKMKGAKLIEVAPGEYKIKLED